METVSSRSKKERFKFINQHGSSLGVRYLCNWLSVSSAGFYKWRGRQDCQRDLDNRQLVEKIYTLFYRHHTNYGSPRICAALRDEGIHVNHKRVERLMRERGLVGKSGRLYRRKAVSKSFYTKMPNLRVGREPPNRINQQWVGDLTYLKVNSQWRYLAVVMDLYSRRILGWSLGQQKSSTLTRDALVKAIRSRTLESELIFHTDRGSEYGAYLVQDELKQAGIQSSMNRPNFVTDNAHMESFFQSMKTECIKGRGFKSDTELRTTISWYIDDYYNWQRHHSAIGYTNPVEYEKVAV